MSRAYGSLRDRRDDRAECRGRCPSAEVTTISGKAAGCRASSPAVRRTASARPAADGLSALVSTAWKVTAERSSSTMISTSTRLRSVAGVDQQEGPAQRGPAGEIGAEQRLPALDDRLRRLGEAVAGQVDEIVALAQREEVDLLGAARAYSRRGRGRLRPTSALIRLDLPTFERPAKQTSARSAGGSPSMATTPFRNSTGPAKSRRPASSASGSGTGASVKVTFISRAACGRVGGASASGRRASAPPARSPLGGRPPLRPPPPERPFRPRVACSAPVGGAPRLPDRISADMKSLEKRWRERRALPATDGPGHGRASARSPTATRPPSTTSA